MLRALSIRHFAIIDHVDLEFASGFCVISGETGAGKSILIDALGLLLGERASAGLVATDAAQADLSAEFELQEGSDALAWLRAQALDEGRQLILRRVIPADGSSRAWINGRSATISQLAEIGEKLVEIHGQHAHQLIGRPGVQRELLDRELPPALLTRVVEDHTNWQAATAALARFEEDCGDAAQMDLLRFQFSELEALGLQPGEYGTLEQDQERLARSDEIRASLATARRALDDDSGPSVRDLLISACSAIERVAGLHPQLGEIATLLGESRINIDEAIAALERAADGEEDDPQALEQINRRLEKALDLARKHRVRPDELPELEARLRARLDSFDQQDGRRQKLQHELDASVAAWHQSALQLSTARRAAAGPLAARVAARLAELGMDQARVEIAVENARDAAPSPHGQDTIRILLSANPGQALQPIQKVASGGELSRVSLALMISSGRQAGVPARVFDEVDAGIGGETAHAVGRFLREAAAGTQAFCVTHLAQVAARADHHYRVQKRSSDGKTRISVEALGAADREQELARMLGSRDSASSLAHARELLQS
ncbi:MAG: DNA repair protein RecN [Wenzhouxiangella sp.]